jgi:hypothetical protein
MITALRGTPSFDASDSWEQQRRKQCRSGFGKS